MKLPLARSPRKRTSASVPRRVPSKVGHLGHHEHRDDQGPRVVLRGASKAPCVVLVISVDVGVQGTGVDEQRYRFTSARRISSIRSEISEWPLCRRARSHQAPLAPSPTQVSFDRFSCQFRDGRGAPLGFVAQASVKIVGEFYGGSLHSMPAYQPGNHRDLRTPLRPSGSCRSLMTVNSFVEVITPMA